jgi:hypothetical protein
MQLKPVIMTKQKHNRKLKACTAIKVLAICAVIILSQIPILSNKAQAQDSSINSPSGSGQEVVCRGDRNWAAYGVTIWNQVMDPRDFWEYWKDIIYRYADNFCHYEDIYGLLKRSEKAAEQVRKAFYNCTSTDKIVRSYYRLEAEIYFLRYYIDYNTVEIPDADGNKVKTTQYFIKGKDSHWTDFNDNLFKTNKEIDDLYTEYEAKYNGRMDTYNKCKDPGIENLIVRFNEDMEYLKNTAKAAAKSVAKKAVRFYDTASNLVKAVRSGEYFSAMLQVNINGMPCPIIGAALAPSKEEHAKLLAAAEKEYNDTLAKAANDTGAEAKAAVESARTKLEAAKKDPKKECAMAFQDIKEAIAKNTPAWLGISFFNLQNKAANVAKQVVNLKTDADVMAKDDFLYYEGSDNIIGEFVKRQKSLLNIIGGAKTSPKFLQQTINCVRGIEKSQCNNISFGG